MLRKTKTTEQAGLTSLTWNNEQVRVTDKELCCPRNRHYITHGEEKRYSHALFSIYPAHTNTTFLFHLKGTTLFFQQMTEDRVCTSAVSCMSLFECWGRPPPGVLLLTYCVTEASKTAGRLFKNTFLLTGTRDNVTVTAWVTQLVCSYMWGVNGFTFI